MKFNKEKIKKTGKKVLKGLAVVGGAALTVGGVLYLAKRDDYNEKNEITLFGDFNTWEEPKEYVGIVDNVQLFSLGEVGEQFANMHGIVDDAPCYVTIEVPK